MGADASLVSPSSQGPSETPAGIFSCRMGYSQAVCAGLALMKFCGSLIQGLSLLSSTLG